MEPEVLVKKYLEESARKWGIRSLARRLNVSPTYVSLIVSGKKNLPMKRAVQISQLMRWDEKRQKEFLTAVSVQSSKRLPQSRILALAYLETRKWEEKKGLSEHDDLPCTDKVLERWYHLAMMDLVACRGFQPSIEWIAKRLGITRRQARSSVELLFKLNLLHVDKAGKWVKTTDHIHFPTTKPLSSLRKLHQQFLGCSIQALKSGKKEDFARRSVSGGTMSIDSSKLAEADELITKFHSQMSELLTEGESDQVYHFGIQLIPLTRPDQEP